VTFSRKREAIPLLDGGEEFFGCFCRDEGFLGFFAQGMKFAIANSEFSKMPDGLGRPIELTNQREMF